VVAVALHAGEAKGQAAGIARARLQIAEGDLRDDFGPYVDRVSVAADLAGEKRLRLPGEHRVGESLERLAEHDVLAGGRVERAEMEVRERAGAAAVAPFGRDDD